MRVAELWRYPVKSMRGERLARADVLADGFAGDRLLRVEDGRGLVTARRKQRLVGVETGIDGAGEPLVEGEAWELPATAARVRELVGPEARLVRTDGGKRFDAAPVLVCTDGALAAHGADRRRFRPNVVVIGVEGLGERDWVGGELTIGEVVLRVVEVCERCAVTAIDPDTIEVDPEVLRRTNEEFGGIMGVYCAVARTGTIAVADEVKVGDGS
ncbi:MAG TPA: MOSC N-terminal beta barrel domain-containing protein [Solirubrobacterales bacterium]